MRTKRYTPLLALALLAFAAPQAASAAAAAGNYQFTMAGDKYLKYVEFEAAGRDDGSATGYIYMTDEAIINTQDVDGTGEKGRLVGYNFKAEVDGLVVVESQVEVDGKAVIEKRAVLSATIRDASDQSFIGRRVLLTVLDGGDDPRVPDKLTWGVYRPIQRTWVPSDAERKEDPGVGLRWWATDAERRGDVGYQMPRDETLNGQTYPASTYSFADVENTAGDIRVSS